MTSARTAAGQGQPAVAPAPRPRGDRLSAREVAALLGCHQDTVYQWAEAGVIPARRWGQRSWWFSRQEIEAHVAQQTQAPGLAASDVAVVPDEALALSHELASLALRLARYAGREGRS